jgi:DMSO reductase anchor subunit
MLVLTQLAAGAFAFDRVLPFVLSGDSLTKARPVHGVFALVLALLAIAASTSHLGRPQFAFRAVLGLRTSWLSREIVAFGAFAGTAMLYAASLLVPQLRAIDRLPAGMGSATAVIGLFAVFTSVMVYHVTGRRWWSGERTAMRFYGTAAVLGVATVLCSAFVTAAMSGPTLTPELAHFGRVGAVALASATLLKLAGEASALRHLRAKQHTELKRSALLLVGELSPQTTARAGLAVVGGVALPLAGLLGLQPQDTTLAVVVSCAAFALLLAGEVLERMAFFAALSSPRMPGALR